MEDHISSFTDSAPVVTHPLSAVMAETSAIHLPQDERGIAEEPLEESNCCGIPDHVYTPSQESYMQSLEVRSDFDKLNLADS